MSAFTLEEIEILEKMCPPLKFNPSPTDIFTIEKIENSDDYIPALITNEYIVSREIIEKYEGALEKLNEELEQLEEAKKVDPEIMKLEINI